MIFSESPKFFDLKIIKIFLKPDILLIYFLTFKTFFLS